jgi:dynein heavy chain
MDMAWVENFNTLLDDNSVLCLESGECWALAPNTRIVFEATDLGRVSPATVSRCGLVYVGAGCLTWQQLFTAWFNKIKSEAWLENHDVILQQLFEWLLPPLLACTASCSLAAAISPLNLVQGSLDLFRVLLAEALPGLKERKYLRGWIQAGVVYACIWTLGGCLADEAERAKFDQGIREVIFGKRADCPLPKSLNGKFDALPPIEGLIFEFVFDFKARGQWKHWNDIIKNMEIEDLYNYHEVLVPTIDSARYLHMIDLAIKRNKPLLLIGPRGTGKTAYLNNRITQGLDPATEQALTLNLTPRIQQSTIFNSIVARLNKHRRGVFGPPEGFKMIIFLDNLGLPLPDSHGDQPATELIHQLLDHGSVYHPEDFSPVELLNTTIVATTATHYGMNQQISDRTLRHFHVVSTTPPTDESVNKIFSSRFNVFFKTRGFQPEAAGVIGPIIQSTIAIYNTLRDTLLPVPEKAHYIFGLSDIAKLMDGCTLLPKELSDNKKLYTRIWVHECLRVFNDRLTCPEDTAILFEKIKHCVKTVFRENFDSAFEHLGKVDGFVTEYSLRNLTFGDFITVEDRRCYQEIVSFDEFGKQGRAMVDAYMAAHPHCPTEVMFFKYSMENICKICRVLCQPSGNILLLGRGGTGRETSARVAAVLKDATFYQPPVSASFTFLEWRGQIKALLREAGGSGTCCVLYLTIETLSVPEFMTDINTLLTNGQIDGLFSVDERYEITEQVHQYLKASKAEGEKELSPDELYTKFLERCMDNFHMVTKLPSDTQDMRQLCRTYPELLAKSVVCHFPEWPDDALQKSAEMIFEDLAVTREERKAIIQSGKEFYHFAKEKATEVNAVHGHRIEISPASYLTFIQFFRSLFQTKQAEVAQRRKQYEDVLKKYEAIQTEIQELEKELVELGLQSTALDEEHGVIQGKIDSETAVLGGLARALEEEAAEVDREKGKLAVIKEDCDKEFREVLQKICDCVAALKALEPAELQGTVSMKKPPAALKRTVAAVALLLGCQPTMVPDPNSKKKDAEEVPDYWPPGRKLLQDPELVSRIEEFARDQIAEETVGALRNIAPDFDPAVVAKTSVPGAALCLWVRATDTFIAIDRANLDKKTALKEAEEFFEEFQLTYKSKKKALDDQEELLSGLKQEQQENKEKKRELREEGENWKMRVMRGQELVSTFMEEREWWQEALARQEAAQACLLGDLLLVATMVSYLPSLPHPAREASLTSFCATLESREIKVSSTTDRFSLFLSKIQMKTWQQNGLPDSDFYLCNGLLLSICPRWPLLIDPEQQAVSWLRAQEPGLTLLEATAPDLVPRLAACVRAGGSCLVHGLEDRLDSLLDGLLRKATFTEQGVVSVRIGEQTVPYSPTFKLYLATKRAVVDLPSRLQSHLTIINFAPVTAGLEEHLLRIVVGRERPELRQKTEAAMKQYCEASQLLEENRTRVLALFLQTEGNILENEAAVQSLKECQENINSQLTKICKVCGHQEKIQEVFTGFRPIARHAAVLFETVKKLNSLSEMYCYSLQWFSSLYCYSIENSNKSKLLSKRLRYLSDHLTFNCFMQVSRSLYQEHKRIFTFTLCLDLMIYKEQLETRDVTILMSEAREDLLLPNPTAWLGDPAWRRICSLEQLEPFQGIREDFSTHQQNWKLIFDALEPDSLPLHEPWHSRLPSFLRLVVINILRPDKLSELLDSFISDHLGFKFVEPLSFDLGRILADNGPRVPMVFLLHPSKDPMKMVKRLKVERDGQGEAGGLEVLCLTPDLEPVILAAVEAGLRDGNWVIIQDCHLATDCSTLLERLMARLAAVPEVPPMLLITRTLAGAPRLPAVADSAAARDGTGCAW